MKILNQIKDNIYYSSVEDLGIKTKLINIFILVFMVYKIPYYLYEPDVSILFKIFVPLGIVIFTGLSFYLLYIKWINLASYISSTMIVIAFTLILFTEKSFVSFLSIFLVLTILMIYQKIRYYLIFGLVTVVSGLVFIYYNGDQITSVNGTFIYEEKVIYIVSLLFVFLFYLIQMLVLRMENKKIANNYVEIDTYIKRYQNVAMHYFKEENNIVFSSSEFKNTVNDIAVFIAKILKPDYDMEQLINHYFNNDAEQVIDVDDELQNLLDRYKLNERSDFISMILNFSTIQRKDEIFSEDRYKIKMKDICNNVQEEIVALVLLYVYILKEKTQYDEKGNELDRLNLEDIDNIILQSRFTNMLTDSQIRFYKNNKEIFMKIAQ